MPSEGFLRHVRARLDDRAESTPVRAAVSEDDGVHVNDTTHNFKRQIAWLSAVFFILAIGLNACGASDETSDLSKRSEGGEAQIVDAQTKLFENDPRAANRAYAEILSEGENPEARAGSALTQLLLLPYHDDVTELLTCCLGASRGLDADSDILYGPDGLFYLLSLGVPFEDEEGYPGIKTLLAPDLPWARSRLDSFADFFNGLDNDVNRFADALWNVTRAIEPIERDLQAVLDDPDFKSYFMPGEVFHERDLSLIFGKSELAALKAVLSATRGVIGFVTAYDYSWTFDEAFGSGTRVDSDDPRYVEGWESGDYSLNLLSTSLFRTIRHPERLADAREAMEDSLESLRNAISIGLERGGYEFDWDEANPSTAREFDEVLDATRSALYGGHSIPYSTPSTTFDLSPFFEEGRTLDTESNWLERDDSDNEWSLDDEAFDTFWIEGIFEPSFSHEDPPKLTFSGAFDDFVDALVGGLGNSFEDAYLSGR